MKTMEFPERLELINSITDKRFGMRLKREMPVKSSKGVARGGTARIVDHTIACEYKEAVALLGVEAAVDGSAEGAKVWALLDGEEVLRGGLEGRSPTVFGDFLPTKVLFTADDDNGSKVGMFMPNATQVRVVVTIPKGTGPKVTVKATLRMALYEAVDAQGS